jgi:hypothetical protein
MSKLRNQLLASLAVLGLAAVSAQADQIIPNDPTSKGTMTVSETVTQGTGDLAGFELHRFYAAFSSASPEAQAGAHGLQSVKVTLSSANGFKFLTGQFAAPTFPTNPDVDITGSNADDATYRSATTMGDPMQFTGIGTGVFVHDPDFDAFSVQGVAVDGTPRSTTAYNATSPTAGGSALFTNAKSFRVEGFTQNPNPATPENPFGGDPSALTSNTTAGSGALFAMAIVPTGTGVGIEGILAADKGDTTVFASSGAVPEPGSLAFIGLGAVGFLARRRRQA